MCENQIESNGFTRQEVTEIRNAVEKNNKRSGNKIKKLMITLTLIYVGIALFNYYIIPFISNNPLTF